MHTEFNSVTSALNCYSVSMNEVLIMKFETTCLLYHTVGPLNLGFIIFIVGGMSQSHDQETGNQAKVMLA